ncbi:peptide chain release factor N(5)-glutamine methyltransferase [Actinomycetaceae bacterium MB13-C1-2]|nr:peptide chain release factor N(5)-glutamine methyltransferase [Actinomycetaceae bacterium MB13-C1-2]
MDAGKINEEPITVRPQRGTDATIALPVLLAWGRKQLGRAGLPPVEAEWLLKWTTGHESLILAPQQMGIRAAENYRSAIAQRRARVPLQHITGQMQFRELSLLAGKGVFATRPETEMLVDLAKEEVATNRPRIADLCAGSGAIGLALAVELPSSKVWLVERSPEAMSYLKRNVKSIEVGDDRVITVLADALDALPELDGTLDLVVSNPPYVGLADRPTQPEALADPEMALYGGGEDGLVIPRGIIGRAFELLKRDGTLVMEHGERQGHSLCEHALSVGFTITSTRYDLAGRPRFLVATKGADILEDRE